MQYKTYDSYKESGVSWLGKIPSHWDILPGHTCMQESRQKNIGLKEKTVLSLSYGRVIVKSEDKLTGLVPESFETYQIVKPGDIIIRGTDLQNDVTSLRTGLAKDDGIITSAYINLRTTNHVTPDYLHYLLHAFDTMKVYYGMGSGLRQNLDYRDFKKLKITIPSRNEQGRIVVFLDHKITEIEAAIEKKQRLIELLKEQKSILINQAVTKGLNPNAPMKDSGVTWIGKIPDHWEIVANRYLFREANDRSKGGLETHLSMSQKLGLVPANQVEKSLTSESYDGAKLVQVNDLVLNRLKAHLSVFSSAYCSGLVSPDYSVFRLISPKNTVFYFENLFRTSGYLGEFNRRVKGIVVGFLRLYSDDFMSIPTIVPPANEQLEICARLKKINEEFAVVFNTTEKEIAKLNEFKQTLIAHAVTGKIKV